jgi:hypothetical protein
MFLNTAVLTLVVNADWGIVGVETVAGLAQNYGDFTPDWYTTVGAALTVTMLLNIFAPHVMSLVKWAGRACRRRVARGLPPCVGCTRVACCCVEACWGTEAALETEARARSDSAPQAGGRVWRRGCCGALCMTVCCRPTTQRGLNDTYTGPEFRLSARYSQLLQTVFTTLLFSSGIPILLPVAVVAFFVSYWVDKIMLLRWYRTPPHYDTSLGRAMSGMLPYGLLLHIAFGAWMYSNRAIFNTEELSIDEINAGASVALGNSNSVAAVAWRERLTQRHVLPFVLLLLLGTVAVVFLKLVRGLGSCCDRCWNVLTCGSCSCTGVAWNTPVHVTPMPPFTQSAAAGLLHDIPSYNILMNPQFADAFAVTSSFAQKFSSVADVAAFHNVQTGKTLAETRRAMHKKAKAAELTRRKQDADTAATVERMQRQAEKARHVPGARPKPTGAAAARARAKK